MAKFFITYGLGSKLSNCYSVIEAGDYAAGRRAAFNATGGDYAFFYDDEADFARQVARYGFTEVPIQPQGVIS